MADHLGRDLEITWSRVLAVWWLITWRAAVLGTLVVLVLGYVLGFAMGALGMDLRSIDLAGQIIGMAIYALALLVTVRMALKKRFGDFRVALLPPEG